MTKETVAKIASSLAAAIIAGAGASITSNPAGGWKAHGMAGSAAGLAYLLGLFQQSPRA